MPADTSRTEVRAVAKYVRTAPRKAQLVADQIRGRSVPEARTILAFMTRDAARDVEKVLTSAVANAEANHSLDGDELVVATAEIGAGPTLKRWRARARGRVGRIRKRTCHISITLALRDGGVIAEPTPTPVERRRRGPRTETTEAPETTQETVPTTDETEAPAAEEPPEAAEATQPTETEDEAEEKPKRAPRSEAAEAAPAEAQPKPRRSRRKAGDESSAEEPSADPDSTESED